MRLCVVQVSIQRLNRRIAPSYQAVFEIIESCRQFIVQVQIEVEVAMFDHPIIDLIDQIVQRRECFVQCFVHRSHHGTLWLVCSTMPCGFMGCGDADRIKVTEICQPERRSPPHHTPHPSASIRTTRIFPTSSLRSSTGVSSIIGSVLRTS